MDQDVKNEEQLNSTPLKAGGLVDPSILIIFELNDKTLGGRDLAPSAVTGEGDIFVSLL